MLFDLMIYDSLKAMMKIIFITIPKMVWYIAKVIGLHLAIALAVPLTLAYPYIHDCQPAIIGQVYDTAAPIAVAAAGIIGIVWKISQALRNITGTNG